MEHGKSKQVPAAALRFSVGEFELGDNGETAKSAPFRMVARSGQPIEHWFWGRVVHDLSGMRAKGRVPIDYAHNESEIIGYANRFDADSGDLVVGGALVPFKDSDRATEVVFKAKAGVPYEASINFGGDGIKVEKVAEGRSVEVNGYTFSGPGVVVREWPLRGIAVCPYGADMNTSTQLSQDAQATVEVTEIDDMETQDAVQEETTQPAAEEVVEITATVEAPAAVLDSAVESAEQPADVEAATTELSQSRNEGLRFLESFGDRGGVWFAQGLTFAEAQSKAISELRAENEALKQRLSARSVDGEESPVAFSEHALPKPKATLIRIGGRPKK